MEVEPIYCAEQIVVPPDLADILKAFTKEIIRRQPGDLIDFSAKYFANLANVSGSVQGTPAPTREQLHQILERTAGETTLASIQLSALCSQAGLARGAVAKILEAGRFSAESVNVDHFVFLLLAMSCASFGALMKAMFEVFPERPGGPIAPPRFIALVSHLGPDMDPDVTPQFMEALVASLEGYREISTHTVTVNPILSPKL